MQAHHKHTLVGFDTYTIPAINGATTYCAITCAYGGPGGIRTPVQDTFLSTSYNYKIKKHTTYAGCSQLPAEGHSPERLRIYLLSGK